VGCLSKGTPFRKVSLDIYGIGEMSVSLRPTYLAYERVVGGWFLRRGKKAVYYEGVISYYVFGYGAILRLYGRNCVLQNLTPNKGQSAYNPAIVYLF